MRCWNDLKPRSSHSPRPLPPDNKRKVGKTPTPKERDEPVSLHGPEYEKLVKSLLDTPRSDQDTSEEAEGSEGDSR